MKRTAIYMRVSSDRQAQEGDSIPAQRDALRKYIDDHADLTYAGEYLDDGVSGTRDDRDEVISGSVPPGFSIVDKHLVPNEDADAVRQVFEFYNRTGNLHETMRFASSFGVFPSTSSAFKKLLQNPSYIGVKRGNNHFCEEIVDRDLFFEIQRKLSLNVKVSQKRVYIFSGLIRCAECGNIMAGLQQHQFRSFLSKRQRWAGFILPYILFFYLFTFYFLLSTLGWLLLRFACRLLQSAPCLPPRTVPVVPKRTAVVSECHAPIPLWYAVGCGTSSRTSPATALSVP